MGPSLLPLLHLSISPLLFFFLFFPSPFPPQGDEQMFSIYTSLSFFCHFLFIGPCQGWFKSFHAPFPSHMNSWESVLGKYGDDTIGIYEFVERNNLFCFATALSTRSTSEFWYSLSTEFLYFQKLGLHSAPHDLFLGSWNYDQVERKSSAWVKQIKAKTKHSFKMKWIGDLESWWGSRFHIKLGSVKTLHMKCLHQSSFCSSWGVWRKRQHENFSSWVVRIVTMCSLWWSPQSNSCSRYCTEYFGFLNFPFVARQLAWRS